jgi:hypothetical protein
MYVAGVGPHTSVTHFKDPNGNILFSVTGQFTINYPEYPVAIIAHNAPLILPGAGDYVVEVGIDNDPPRKVGEFKVGYVTGHPPQENEKTS